jgi:phage-related protein/DNA-binding XRE family transcriptional regulator
VVHGEIRTPPFSPAARIEAGTLLRRLQRAETLSLPHSRPMPTIGPRCHELRVPDEKLTWRIMYHLAHDAVVMLELFEKKTSRTSRHVIETCRRRLRWYVETAGEYAMKRVKKARLEAAGWRVGDAADFLALSDAERALVETRLALAEGVRQRRRRQRLTQTQLARHLGSSQSRVAKIEAADASVSLDLMVRSLFRLGASKADIARLIRRGPHVGAA